MPEITVILLSYNRPQFVKQAIHSALWQTFEDFELLVVDNSTDDETRQVLESFKDERIKLCYENPTNDERKKIGIIALYYNKYVEIAQGKYVFLFSDDDILLPDCLEELHKYAETNEVACCYLGQFWMNYKDGSWTLWQHREYHTIFDANHNPSCVIGGASCLVRKDCLNEIEKPYMPLAKGHSGIADGMFLEKVAKKFSIYPVKKTLSIIRFHNKRYT